MNNYLELPSLQFPPYGIMNNDYLKNLGSKNVLGSPAEPTVPPDFEAPHCEGSQRERCWTELRDQTITDIADVLWPVWDPDDGSWKGAAVDKMLDLTRADLKILLSLRVGSGPLAFNNIPDSPLRALNCRPHSAFFLEEDQGKIFASYSFYDRTLDPKFSPMFSDAFFAGLSTKCSSTQLQFKRRFQRPRPFQMAFLMNETDFNLEEAISSMTPSMVSGHSLQGLIGVGAVMEQIIQTGIPFKSDAKEAWESLEQYAVDIGDRRVFAGIHYPSDNLSSWIVLMRFATFIYRSRAVKKKLWHAIKERSMVYQLIRTAQDKGANVYSSSLELLEQAAEAD